MATTVEQAYEKYKQKVEKNATNDGVSTDRGRFVNIYNESQNKFLEFNLQNRGADDVRYVEKFLILDKDIPCSSTLKDHQNFPLPENYFDLADVRGIASKGKCNQIPLYMFEIRTENKSEVLQDEDNKPSFFWREAPYTINQNTVSVYNDNDFKVDHILLDYYRYPNQIAQVDENDPESKFEDLELEWDDKSLDRIISMCAQEFDLNENNPRFQLQQLRQQK